MKTHRILIYRLLLSACTVVFIAGCCAPTHSIVLVPDPDGAVGKAEVKTLAGTELLSQANTITKVSGAQNPPSKAISADPQYLAATFADALAVEPPMTEKYIIFFESGQSGLTDASYAVVDKILAAIKLRNATSVAVIGHSDASGSVKINDELSQKRAELVRDNLLQRGVNPAILSATSHGKGNPLVPTADGVAEPKNRRVEVIIR